MPKEVQETVYRRENGQLSKAISRLAAYLVRDIAGVPDMSLQ